ncbi:MAG: hypothetical protein JO142_14495 [Burkholderiales bacterium]|nr:hypothetical protein [Burkholderiales bacterium]
MTALLYIPVADAPVAGPVELELNDLLQVSGALRPAADTLLSTQDATPMPYRGV